MQIELSPEAETLVNRVMQYGYRSPEEAVEAALKLLQKRIAEKIEALRAEILPALEASQRGESTALDIEEIIAEAQQQQFENQKKAA